MFFHINTDEEDVFDMVSALIPLLTKWKEIGTALGLRHSALEIIEATNKGGARMCMQGMLVQYVRKSYNCDRFGDPSWMCLCKAIAHPAGGNNEELAESISKEHPTKGIHVYACTNLYCCSLFNYLTDQSDSLVIMSLKSTYLMRFCMCSDPGSPV